MSSNGSVEHASELRAELARLEKVLGRRPKVLVAELGVAGHDAGHTNRVDRIAGKARDAGFDVVYEGGSATPEQVVTSALEEDVHLIGLAVAHDAEPTLVGQLASRAQAAGIGAVPVVVATDESKLDDVVDDLVRLAAQTRPH